MEEHEETMRHLQPPFFASETCYCFPYHLSWPQPHFQVPLHMLPFFASICLKHIKKKKIRENHDLTCCGPTQSILSPPVKSVFFSPSSIEMAYSIARKVTSKLILPSAAGWLHTLPSWKPPVLQLSETPYASCFPPFPCHDTLPHLQPPVTNSAI